MAKYIDLMTRPTEYSVIGKSLPRVDGVIKAKGQQEYTDDMVLPRMLYGKILYSKYAHAKIIKIDTSKAKALPGVHAVLTGKDVSHTMKMGFYMDNPPLKKSKVCSFRDEVAAVAALDRAVGVPVAGALGDAPVHGVVHDRLAELEHGGLGLGHIDEHPPAGLAALVEGHDDYEDRARPGGLIAVVDRGVRGHVPVSVTPEIGVSQEVVLVGAQGAVVLVWSRLAEAGHGDHDDLGIPFADHVVGEAEVECHLP